MKGGALFIIWILHGKNGELYAWWYSEKHGTAAGFYRYLHPAVPKCTFIRTMYLMISKWFFA
jgi:hypothetical protein